ncbi:MAG TPA: STAS domain-containing protein [Lacipirellulaceae bacterium]|nr:STAS domain-containing protein [Lacipirellulaceae bacterium]
MFEHKCQGAVDVISGGDRISGEHVAELAALLETCVERGQPQIVLDLHSVAVIDSAGLELLLDYQEKCQRMGGALKLANAGTLCREVLKATGVGARFETFRDSGGAVRSFVQ